MIPPQQSVIEMEAGVLILLITIALVLVSYVHDNLYNC